MATRTSLTPTPRATEGMVVQSTNPDQQAKMEPSATESCGSVGVAWSEGSWEPILSPASQNRLLVLLLPVTAGLGVEQVSE